LASARLAGLVRDATGHPPEPVPAGVPLTRRERDVMDLLARGLSNRHIADRLGISIRTTESHVASILRKLNVPSRAALAARYGPRMSV
jgi:DNA-binding NarL/FixJ family response regulator